MRRDLLSVRQMMILLIVALVGPAVDLLPGVAANRGGWAAVLLALPLLLAAVWLNGKVFHGQKIWGSKRRPAVYTIIIMYMLWALIVLAAVLRQVAVRMEMIYPAVPSWLFGGVLAVLAAWMARGTASALARAAEVFYLGLTVLLAGILILGAFQLEWKNLLQFDWSMVPGGGVVTAGICMSVAPAAILGSEIPKDAGSLRKACGWTAAFVLVITLLVAVVIGTLGNSLSARLERPFLIMVQGLRVKGAFQRTESLVAAMCLLSDAIFAGLLLRAWGTFAKQIKKDSWGSRSVPVAAVAALIGGWLLFPDGNELRVLWSGVLSAGGLFFGLVIPIYLLVITVRKGDK